MREALKLVKHEKKKEPSSKLRLDFEVQPQVQDVEELSETELGERRFVAVYKEFKRLSGELEKSSPKLSALIDDGIDDVLTYLQFPEAHHRKIHSTNLIGRLNREIKRRARAVSLFPNDQTILRLVTMLLIEQDDE